MSKKDEHTHVIKRTDAKGTHVVCNQSEPCAYAKLTQERIDKGKTENRSHEFKRSN